MRVKHNILGKYGNSFRITPAHAGKTVKAIYQRDVNNGSPPLMRVKHQEVDLKAIDTGITPAHAGKT